MSGKMLIKTFIMRKKAKVGVVLVSIPLIMALTAEWIAPYSPFKCVGLPYEKPSVKHLLGTDDIGHDLFSQLIYGARVSLTVGVLSAIIATFLGVAVGMLAGYIGGKLDDVLMMATDIVLVLPYIVIVIVLVAYIGPTLWNMIMCIGILGWPTIARMVRSQVLSLKNRLYVEAALALGGTKWYVMRKYILPNLFVLIIPVTVLTIIDGILTEAGLSFLGLGDLTQPSWGLMLFYAQSRGAFIKGAWWWIIPPGLMITLTSLGMIILSQELDVVLKLKAHLMTL